MTSLQKPRKPGPLILHHTEYYESKIILTPDQMTAPPVAESELPLSQTSLPDGQTVSHFSAHENGHQMVSRD